MPPHSSRLAPQCSAATAAATAAASDADAIARADVLPAQQSAASLATSSAPPATATATAGSAATAAATRVSSPMLQPQHGQGDVCLHVRTSDRVQILSVEPPMPADTECFYQVRFLVSDNVRGVPASALALPQPVVGECWTYNGVQVTVTSVEPPTPNDPGVCQVRLAGGNVREVKRDELRPGASTASPSLGASAASPSLTPSPAASTTPDGPTLTRLSPAATTNTSQISELSLSCVFAHI